MKIKKVALFFIFGILVSYLIPVNKVYATENKALTPYEIQYQLEKIGNSYHQGDVLSEEDADFIARYAPRVDFSEMLFSSFELTSSQGSIYGSRNVYGVSAEIYGNIWHTGTFNYNFGGNVTGRIISGQTPKKMKLIISCQSYGLVGGSTVLSYSDSVTNEASYSRTISMSKSKNYSGVAAFYVVQATLDVTTSNGNAFTINAN